MTMATVKIGKELREAVEKAARRIFTIKKESLTREMVEESQLLDTLYNTIMSPYLPIIAQLPKEMVRQTNELTFIVKDVRYKAKFATDKPWFSKVPKNELLDGARYYETDVVLQESAPEWKDIVEHTVAYKLKLADIDEQEKTFVNGVRTIMNNYSTLAPALKAWPPLWDLLSEDVKEKHKEVVERKKAEQVELNVDLSKLTSTVVAHKIGA
jgi:hypothetical protein